MTPLEFLEHEEASSAYKHGALARPIIISSGDKDYVVLSYYYSPEYRKMCLDIAPIDAQPGDTFDADGEKCL